jgi:hypothetical protein
LSAGRVVGLPGWLLLAPPLALGLGMSLMVLSAWGVRDDGFGQFASTAGGLLTLSAMFAAWVVAPVSTYSLVANAALRTAPRLLATAISALVAAFPVLAVLFGGGV